MVPMNYLSIRIVVFIEKKINITSYSYTRRKDKSMKNKKTKIENIIPYIEILDFMEQI